MVKPAEPMSVLLVSQTAVVAVVVAVVVIVVAAAVGVNADERKLFYVLLECD